MMTLTPEEIPECPYCDQPIEFDDYVVMQAYGQFYLAHQDCVEDGSDG